MLTQIKNSGKSDHVNRLSKSSYSSEIIIDDKDFLNEFSLSLRSSIKSNRIVEDENIHKVYSYNRNKPLVKRGVTKMDYDLTHEKIKSTMPLVLQEKNEEILKLKDYILRNSISNKKSDQEVCLDLYAKRLFSMSDIKHYLNISTEEFMDLLIEKNVPFQYEDDFEISDQEIEDWL